MVDVADQGAQIEERDDLGDNDAALFAYWAAQEEIAEREEKKWIKQGRAIVKRYRDERPEAIEGTHRFNILWSNVQTLIPTYYGRTPKPDVERRYKDNDPVGRLASTVLERCLAFSIDAQEDESDFDSVMEAAVEERLLPGRGTCRVLYVPHFGDEIEPTQTEGDEAAVTSNDEFEDAEEQGITVDNPGDEEEDKSEPEREVVYEEVLAEQVFWEDYREGPARKWREVPWVRYRSYLTREQLTKRFGKKNADLVTLDYTPKGSPTESTKDEPPADIYKKAEVHEIWDKTRREVVWRAPGTPDLILDKRSDPLRLPGFFPGPKPLLATSTTDKRIPVPDYIEYQDQARELDRLTARIDKLTGALKVAGVYAAEEKQVLQQLLDEGTENRLIPVGDLQGWTDKGGMKGLIEWLPIQQIAETLIQLHNARDRVKALLYELTGIGDIMRGMTEPDETAAAQKLKANFSTRRVTPQQKKVAKFAKNTLRLMAGVIAEHFSAKTISMISGYPQLDPVPQVPPQPQAPQQPLQIQGPAPAQPLLQAGAPAGPGAANGGAAPAAAPPNPQMQAYQQQMAQWQQANAAAQQVQVANQEKQQQFDAAVALIKQDGVHGFRIDIEADSTIAIDEAEDQENRVEFMGKFIPLLEQLLPVAQGNPAAAGLGKELTLFSMRGFRVARSLEEMVSNFFDAIGKMPPPQPKGAAGGADSPQDLAIRSQQIQADNNKTNAQLQLGQEKNAIEMAKLGQTAHDNAAELASRETADRARHMLDVGKAQDESAFRRERASVMESREASRLS